MNNILSIKRSKKLNFSKDEVWNVITTPNYLNETHPFCKNNTVVTWPGVGSKDILEYLSWLTFEREFTQWNENGYDLVIGTKNGKKSKVNHLTYIGDSVIGKSVNVGAGTITCNYDGVKKSKTKIKDNVFIGSNSSLVTPLTIEEGSIIGAGSVITKNVKKKSLALTRSLQTEIRNYKRKSK